MVLLFRSPCRNCSNDPTHAGRRPTPRRADKKDRVVTMDVLRRLGTVAGNDIRGERVRLRFASMPPHLPSTAQNICGGEV
jgi:hypothetical protein